MNTLNNQSDVIDSRDIIERIEELTDLIQENENSTDDSGESDKKELALLLELQRQCIDYASDWEYGETLIRREFFKQYMDEMIEDCYELPKDMPYWMTIKLDYDALEQDYTSVDFDGQEYLIRSI